MYYARFARFSGSLRMQSSGKMIVVLCCALLSCLLVACGGSPAVSQQPTPAPTSLPATPTPTVVVTPTPVPATATPVPQSQAQAAQPTQAAALPAPILDVAPISMGIAGVDCKKTSTVYICQSAVISGPNNRAVLHWTAYANIPGVSFSPAQGSISPGTRVILTITIPIHECLGTFYYQGPVNTHTIIWRC